MMVSPQFMFQCLHAHKTAPRVNIVSIIKTKNHRFMFNKDNNRNFSFSHLPYGYKQFKFAPTGNLAGTGFLQINLD